jgi:hypothetical protein
MRARAPTDEGRASGARRGVVKWLTGLLAGAGIAALSTSALPVAASCAATPPLGQALTTAPVVFVGTVTGLDSGGRVASVHVDDVWRGVGVGSDVTVVGTPDTAAAATSVDRTYVSGQQYLFVPTGGSGTQFQDNQCTATQPYVASLGSLRPAGAPGRPAMAASDAGKYWPVYVVLGLAALVPVGLGIAVLRRRLDKGGTLS